MALLKFSDIKNDHYSPTELSKLLKERTGKKALFQAQPFLIAYEALRQINFKKLIKDKGSVTDHCLLIDKLFFGKVERENAIDFFLKLIFDLGKLPVQEKLRLEERAKKDLDDIDRLLSDYRQEEFIARYEEQHITPRNHRERTLLEFYKRTIEKRNEILNYLVHKVDDLAIERSELKHIRFEREHLDSEALKKMYVQNDFPYTDFIFSENKWEIGIDWVKLDYRKIDLLRHKARFFQFESSISNGYSTQIKKEIAKRFTKNKAQQLLNNIVRQVELLPVLKNRKKIFQSLKSLYKSNQWYGFYALALPQIEGMFSEMVYLVSPEKKRTGALPEKVNLVREFSEYSEYTFDYYEYYLPEQRNRFAHTGNDEDIKVKCAFMLLDLAHLTEVFEKLNAPVLEMNTIVQWGIPYFEHIGKFTRFLQLYRTLKSRNQLKEIDPDAEVFVYSELCTKFDFNSFLPKLEQDFLDSCSSLESYMNMMSHSKNEKELRLFTLKPQQLIQRAGEIEQLTKTGLKLIIDDYLKLVIDVYLFITSFSKEFTKLPTAWAKNIHRFASDHAELLETVRILSTKTKIEIPDDYMLLGHKFLHIKP
jgi:hypothetical protein